MKCIESFCERCGIICHSALSQGEWGCLTWMFQTTSVLMFTVPYAHYQSFWSRALHQAVWRSWGCRSEQERLPALRNACCFPGTAQTAQMKGSSPMVAVRREPLSLREASSASWSPVFSKKEGQLKPVGYSEDRGPRECQ